MFDAFSRSGPGRTTFRSSEFSGEMCRRLLSVIRSGHDNVDSDAALWELAAVVCEDTVGSPPL